MKQLSLRLFIAVSMVFVLSAASPAWCADEKMPDVIDILKQAKEVFEPSQPTLRKVVITLKSENATTKWIAAQAMKEFPDGRRMLLVTLEPEILKGTAYLVEERPGNADKMYLYLPFIRRVREIVSSEVGERFLASDFTYFDLGFIRIHERYRLLGVEELNGAPAYKLEEKMLPTNRQYSKIIAWVDKETLRPLKRDIYDLNGKLWKIETVENVAVIDGVPTPMRTTMEDIQYNTSTELTLSEVQYCGELSDILFDPSYLPKAAADPIWQPYCTIPTKKE